MNNLLDAEPTVNANISLGLYIDLFREKKDWRLYSKNNLDQAEVDKLIQRYVRSHATIPALITDERLSKKPMEVFEFAQDAFRVKGALFANGAVLEITIFDKELTHRCLLIDPKVARVWGYPEEYSIPSELKSIDS